VAREPDGACLGFLRIHKPVPIHPLIMNSIATWNPFRELEDMQHRILRAINVPATRSAEDRQVPGTADWVPALDVSENEHEYLIKAEIPEVKKEDVKVTVENGVLTFRGERRLDQEEKTRKYHRVERSYGSFLRSLAMPDDADPDKVAAEFKDGLLHIHLLKSEAKKPKQIEVSVS
jgi:HSP20 family protein